MADIDDAIAEIDLKTADPNNPVLQRMLKAQTPQDYLSVDVGQSTDPAVIVALRKRLAVPEPIYSVPYMRKFKLGTAYPEVSDEIAKLFAKSPPNRRLVIDGVGIGRAIVDLLRSHVLLRSRRSRIYPIAVHGGQETTYHDLYFHPPKRDCVGMAQVLLQTRRLKVKADLRETPALIREFMEFQVKITPGGRDKYEARQGEHDDLISAIALGVWAGEDKRINFQFKQWNFER